MFICCKRRKLPVPLGEARPMAELGDSYTDSDPPKVPVAPQRDGPHGQASRSVTSPTPTAVPPAPPTAVPPTAMPPAPPTAAPPTGPAVKDAASVIGNSQPAAASRPPAITNSRSLPHPPLGGSSPHSPVPQSSKKVDMLISALDKSIQLVGAVGSLVPVIGTPIGAISQILQQILGIYKVGISYLTCEACVDCFLCPSEFKPTRGIG